MPFVPFQEDDPPVAFSRDPFGWSEEEVDAFARLRWARCARVLLSAEFYLPGWLLFSLLGVIAFVAYVGGCLFPLAELLGGRKATVLKCRGLLAFHGAETGAGLADEVVALTSAATGIATLWR